jgi:hypothetical protein
MTDHLAAPDAELLIAPGCPHCPSVLGGLADLVKQGKLGRLSVINLELHPGEGEARGARAVPWIRIGPFELTGAHRPAELADWAERAGSPAGRRSYLEQQLADGELDQVVSVCRREPAMLAPLIDLAGDLETPFAVRIGVGAVLEELSPDGLLIQLSPTVRDIMANSEHPSVRADAAHFLALTQADAARGPLRSLLEDDDASVREIARESLDALDEALQ